MVAVIDVPIYTRSVAVLAEITLEEFDRFYYDNATKVTDDEYRKIKKKIYRILKMLVELCGG